jgi:hypothetical protein
LAVGVGVGVWVGTRGNDHRVDTVASPITDNCDEVRWAQPRPWSDPYAECARPSSHDPLDSTATDRVVGSEVEDAERTGSARAYNDVCVGDTEWRFDDDRNPNVHDTPHTNTTIRESDLPKKRAPMSKITVCRAPI